ncbi:beta-ketoacyl synthase N-terminal-like domain-containing protein [Streptomyces sp. NPDC002851]
MTRVAVVGLDCRFPAADGAAAYWELLMRGGDAIGPLPRQRWLKGGFDGSVQGGFLGDADVFDHGFFSVSPREAAAMDPQQRLLLTCAWRALEDSGRSPAALSRTADRDTGVFIGVMGSEWAQLHMGAMGAMGGGLGEPARITAQLGSGSSTGMVANRISYHLDLKGPSLAVDTACSSSLVAVHLAVNSLLSGECSTALAGGVNLVLSPALGQVYRHMGLAAPDGRCKPFSTDADGIGRSDGVGAIVLRRLDDALADGQRIYAVIDGTAVNQDGRSNGVTAPSRWSQRDVVAAACRRAGITPADVRFVEAHGTGTVLGDIIECAALGELHAVPRERPCVIGSVKGNLGHTEGAAGIAGLIKAVLALHHRIVPASRHATRENPRLRLAERGLRLLKAPERLPAGPTVAGVSSFGMGGTNAHAVLSSAPRLRRAAVRRGGGRPSGGVFTVSADTPQALRRNLAAQAEAIARRPRGDAAALCWTSNRVKAGLPYRAAFVAEDTVSLAAALRAGAAEPELLPSPAPSRKPDGASGALPPDPRSSNAGGAGFDAGGAGILLLVGGAADALPVGAGARLYAESGLYRAELDRVDAALRPHLDGTSVRDALLARSAEVRRGALARPALFAVGHALFATLCELGAVPDVVLGDGVGELTAAVAEGALALGAAARLAATPTPQERPYAEQDRCTEKLTALLNEHAPTALVHLGPAPLPAAARAALPDGLPLLHAVPDPDAGLSELATVLAELYRAGHELSWDGLYAPEACRFERLAPYAFDTERRFWRSPVAHHVRTEDQADQADQYEPSALRPSSPVEPDATRRAAGDCSVLTAVQEAVTEVGGYEPGRVHRDTRFYEDLAFDSVMLMQLKDRIETRLPQAADVTVQQLLPELRTVGTLAAFLGEWLGHVPPRAGVTS